MKIAYLLTFFLLTVVVTALGQGDQYAVNRIPPELLKNANAVVRDYNEKVTVVSMNEINTVFRYTVTILNKDAYSHSEIFEQYDKTFNEVENISGRLYDKNGEEVRKLIKEDIADVAPFGQYLTFNEHKIKHFDFNYSNYPFTVSFEITKSNKASFLLPSFDPQLGDMRCAVEKATMEIQYSSSFPLRYRVFHLNEQPVITVEDKMKKLTILAAGIMAEKEVEMEPENIYSLPSVIFASDEFEFGGLAGKMGTWKEFGKFFYDLNANRRDLSEQMKKTVHTLTDTCKSNFSKIKVLYEYLKKNTRYIAVEMGIGGWQCVDAKFVCSNEYADCKGLSNYMSAMLKEAGINSYGVLVYGGRNSRRIMQRDFPVNAFNHYILCVPGDKDTVWLECTLKTLPAGYLSNFTGDRDVLLLMPDGGHIVRTPAYGLKENKEIIRTEIHVSANDSFKAVIKLHYTGYLHDIEAGNVINKPKKEIEDHFNRRFSLVGYKITGYSVSESLNDRIPILDEEISIAGVNRVSHTGKRTFVDMATVPINLPDPADVEPRKEPFELPVSFSVCDTETIIIDGKYTTEYIPQEDGFQYPFASYSNKVIFENGNVLKRIREYKQEQGVYQADLFHKYTMLAKAVNSFQKHVVLLKAE